MITFKTYLALTKFMHPEKFSKTDCKIIAVRKEIRKKEFSK